MFNINDKNLISDIQDEFSKLVQDRKRILQNMILNIP